MSGIIKKEFPATIRSQDCPRKSPYLGISNGTGNFTFSSLFWGPGFSTVDALDLNGDGNIDVVIYNTSNAAAYTGISTGNPANPFAYQYSFWGTGKVLATATAQP